jgi:SAM-dependent methyltransferase
MPNALTDTTTPAAIDWGALARTTPIARSFGFDRGSCIDRVFIERFLAVHRADIRGRVLEVAERTYTRRFGDDRVTHSDVLHLSDAAKATVVADLTDAPNIPDQLFDCVILTQTLQHIREPRPALATLARILRPGGVVLATMPGISQISRYDMQRWGDYWRFTPLAARMLFERSFSPTSVEVASHGNVLLAIAFLHGLAVEELPTHAFDLNDPDYPLLVTVRAQRAESHA